MRSRNWHDTVLNELNSARSQCTQSLPLHRQHLTLECEDANGATAMFSVYRYLNNENAFDYCTVESRNSMGLRWNGQPKLISNCYVDDNTLEIFDGRDSTGKPVLVELAVEKRHPMKVAKNVHLD